ncbi:MAG TPA: hypothetical protein VHO25_14445, partial [Polyangiaceae bacterium]|nr:hypothetical protein [Polyangiaceae bacterium]
MDRVNCAAVRPFITLLTPVFLGLAALGCGGGDESSNDPNGAVAGNGAGLGGAGAGGPNGTGGSTAGTTGSLGGGPGTDPADPRLEARAWRLTPAQYNGEVQRFFPGAPTVTLPVGGSEFGLSNIAVAARIDTGNATQFTEAANTIGNWVTTQGASAARCTTFATSECVDTLLD